MRIEDIHLVTPDLILAPAEEVAQAENELGCRFPEGYAEYVQRLGEGTLNDLVYIWRPQRILEQIAWVRDLLDSYGDFWPWDDPESQVDEDRLRESIALGDTNVGDMYFFHRDDPATVLIAPRDLETTYAVGPGLDAAFEWTFGSGHLTRHAPIAEFHAHVPTRYIRFKGVGTSLQAVRDLVASIEGAGRVHQVYPDAASIFFPAVKGLVKLHEFDDGAVYVLLQHQIDAPEADAEDLQLALSRAGFRYETAW